MRQTDTSLERLRDEIDGIDDALHDLLIRRAALTGEIAAAKRRPADAGAGVPAIRPAREARILRRLLARHTGDLPPRVIVRIWRQIIAASLQAQTAYHLHVFNGDPQRAYFDLAHAYFGALTPARGHARASQVVHACAEEPNSLGLVPPPNQDEERVPWWLHLVPAGQMGPRVIAKLPFLLDGDEQPVSAFAIGTVEFESSGDDTTLVRLETDSGLSRGRLSQMLKDAGFEAAIVAAGPAVESGTHSMVLLAVEGFVAADDPRLARLGAGSGIVRVDPVGGFANPVVWPQGAKPQDGGPR